MIRFYSSQLLLGVGQNINKNNPIHVISARFSFPQLIKITNLQQVSSKSDVNYRIVAKKLSKCSEEVVINAARTAFNKPSRKADGI